MKPARNKLREFLSPLFNTKGSKEEEPKSESDSESKSLSLLDIMIDGREYESLNKVKGAKVNIEEEIVKSFAEIKAARKREIICYAGNVVNQILKGSRSIDSTDDLPFSEMVNSVPSGVKDIDVILVTGGGNATQVSKFVDKLRSRFDNVTFLIPNIAMSAGTVFALSGNEIIMGPGSYLGPIDPQVPNQDGMYVPALAILNMVEEIQKRGEELIKKGLQPRWTDQHILRFLDKHSLASGKGFSEHIIKMAEKYLVAYKFRDWVTHSDTKTPVTDVEKAKRASEIANLLCDHSTWKVHDRGITREEAWSLCKLKITPVETNPDLERALRRFWALLYFIFETSLILKIYSSNSYYVAKPGVTTAN